MYPLDIIDEQKILKDLNYRWGIGRRHFVKLLYCNWCGGVTNYITGAWITERGIIQVNPILPKEWKSLTLKGIGPEKKTFVINW